MAVVNPCYKCEDRVVGCHCKCPKYIEFRAIMDQRIKSRVEYRKHHSCYDFDDFDKYAKRKRRKR